MSPATSKGELHRLRGEFAAAARAYHDAAELGRDPAPGVALLRLAEGDVAAAGVAIERMLAANDPRTAPPCWPPPSTSTSRPATSNRRAAANAELARFADLVDAPLLHAIADGAAGAVLLAEGDAGGALVALRRASAGWRTLGMPYDAARGRVGIALACRALGDHEGADVELAAAQARSNNSAPSPISPRSSRFGEPTSAARRSPTGSWRCSGSSPPVARTGRSPPSS